MYVCICRAVTKNDIQKATQRGLCSVGQLAAETGLGTQCGQCLSRTEKLINQCIPDQIPQLAYS